MAILHHAHSPIDNFTIISNAALRDNDISLAARGLYGQLCSHSAGWKISTKDLARHEGVSERTINRLVAELESCGYLARRQERNARGEFVETTYDVLAEKRVYPDPRNMAVGGDLGLSAVSAGVARPSCASVGSELGKQDKNTASNRPSCASVGSELGLHTVSAGRDRPPHMSHIKKTNKKTNKEKQKENYAASAADSFEDWYSNYPKKVSRGHALRAWKQALKKATPEQLHDGLQRYKDWLDSQRVAREFIKNPATWLNGECWEDDYTTTSGVVRGNGFLSLLEESS